MKINLRELRENKKLSIIELGKLSGVDKSTISRIENNELIPTILVLCKLCKIIFL